MAAAGAGVSDERTLLGLLLVRVGGAEVELPRLKLRAARAWRRSALALWADWADVEVRPDALHEAAGILDGIEDAMLDAVVAYDGGGILGGREALEERLLPGELAPLFVTLLNSTLPFDLAAHAEAARSASPKPTNARSPTGASTPTASRSASTPGS